MQLLIVNARVQQRSVTATVATDCYAVIVHSFAAPQRLIDLPFLPFTYDKDIDD